MDACVETEHVLLTFFLLKKCSRESAPFNFFYLNGAYDVASDNIVSCSGSFHAFLSPVWFADVSRGSRPQCLNFRPEVSDYANQYFAVFVSSI